jgi:hypothetical protein
LAGLTTGRRWQVAKAVGPRSAAFESLQATGDEPRKADPKLTKAYSDPANRELVANERAEARAAA